MGSFTLTGMSARLRSVAEGPFGLQGQGAVVLALGLEIGLFVWVAATFMMPSLVALAPPVAVAAVLGLALAFRTGKDRRRRPWPVAAALGRCPRPRCGARCVLGTGDLPSAGPGCAGRQGDLGIHASAGDTRRRRVRQRWPAHISGPGTGVGTRPGSAHGCRPRGITRRAFRALFGSGRGPVQRRQPWSRTRSSPLSIERRPDYTLPRQKHSAGIIRWTKHQTGQKVVTLDV